MSWQKSENKFQGEKGHRNEYEYEISIRQKNK